MRIAMLGAGAMGSVFGGQLTETDNEELVTFVIGHAAGMINRVEENRDPGVPIQSLS